MHPYFSVMDERWFHRAFVYTGSVTDREKNLDHTYFQYSASVSQCRSINP